MIVRIEQIRNSDNILVIDEIGRLIKEVDEMEFFLEHLNSDLEILEEDGYTYYKVDTWKS